MFGLFRKKVVVVAKPKHAPVAHDFDRGDRVEALKTAGFHRGAKGTVAFVQKHASEDGSDHIWVDRDGANDGGVWYHPSELKFEDPPRENLDQQRRLTAARPTRPTV